MTKQAAIVQSPGKGAAELGRRLRALLEDMLMAHQRLLIETQAHREAIRRADGVAIELSTGRQADMLQRLGELDGRRRELTALNPIAGKAAQSVTITDLIGIAPHAQREELLKLAGELRGVMQSVNQEQRTIAAATKSLLAHMEGLMRQVGRTLSHAQTYGRRGVVEPGPAVMSALDLAC